MERKKSTNSSSSSTLGALGASAATSTGFGFSGAVAVVETVAVAAGADLGACAGEASYFLSKKLAIEVCGMHKLAVALKCF